MRNAPSRGSFAEEVLRAYAYQCGMCGFDGALGHYPGGEDLLEGVRGDGSVAPRLELGQVRARLDTVHLIDHPPTSVSRTSHT